MNPALAMRETKLELLDSGINERYLMPFVVYGSTGRVGLELGDATDGGWDSKSIYALFFYITIALVFGGFRSIRKDMKWSDSNL